MEIRPHRIIERKKTKKILVGKVPVGGDSVISVQSMTNTITSNSSWYTFSPQKSYWGSENGSKLFKN